VSKGDCLVGCQQTWYGTEEDFTHSEVWGRGFEYGCWHTIKHHMFSWLRHACILHYCLAGHASATVTLTTSAEVQAKVQRPTSGGRSSVSGFSSAVLRSFVPQHCALHRRGILYLVV
jgi:hypothetical protein